MLPEVAAQPFEDARHFLPYSLCSAKIIATSHVTLSHEVHVCIPRAKLSKTGMCWRRIAKESLLDGLAIWIDSRRISCQSFLSPIVPSVFVVAYRGSEDCGTLAVYKEHSQASRRISRGFSRELGRTSLSLHKNLDQLESA